MTEYTQTQPVPNQDLKSLDRLVGTWKQSGGVEGTVTYEWAEGGFFLIQHVDMESDGRPIKGMEIIGHVQAFGEEPGPDIKSRFFSFLDGMTLDYVYEIDGRYTDNLGWRARLTGVLQRYVQQGWQYHDRWLGVPGRRRLRGDLEAGKIN